MVNKTSEPSPRRLQGHTDTPLNVAGLAQAEALTERLRPYRLDAVVSSDLACAWTTARIVAEGLGVPLVAEPRLREANIGETGLETRSRGLAACAGSRPDPIGGSASRSMAPWCDS
jgi:broad specificity phosphatase PhoE